MNFWTYMLAQFVPMAGLLALVSVAIYTIHYFSAEQCAKRKWPRP